MITTEKIKIYKDFNGDIDGWARMQSQEQKAFMKDSDWFLIENFIQDLLLIKKGIASNAFMVSINERLRENCDNEETIQELKAISDNK